MPPFGDRPTVAWVALVREGALDRVTLIGAPTSTRTCCLQTAVAAPITPERRHARRPSHIHKPHNPAPLASEARQACDKTKPLAGCLTSEHPVPQVLSGTSLAIQTSRIVDGGAIGLHGPQAGVPSLEASGSDAQALPAIGTPLTSRIHPIFHHSAASTVKTAASSPNVHMKTRPLRRSERYPSCLDKRSLTYITWLSAPPRTAARPDRRRGLVYPRRRDTPLVLPPSPVLFPRR